MIDAFTKVFPLLPGPLRTLAASAHGLTLRSWRYGRDHTALVLDAAQRESWSPEQWRQWQEARLAHVLRRAATRVPFYRQYWEGVVGRPLSVAGQAVPGEQAADGRKAGDCPWLELQNWPLLEKEEVRRHPRLFVADDCDTRQMYREHTSGTTGTPMDLWWSRDTVRRWYALFEARWRVWHGVSRYDRWAIFGGQIVAAPDRRKPPFWVWNAPMRQLYLSVYHLAPDLARFYVEALRRYRVVYLYGYTSALYTLAHDVLDQGLSVPDLKVVITNAEPLSEHQREVIGQAFACPVRETYGMTEIVTAAGECEHGRLHLWPEVGIVETRPLANSAGSELICTGLVNADMPLLRYRLGDAAELAPPAEHCPCGRRLPVLRRLEGRSDDVLITADGRRIGRLDPVFKGAMAIREAQIVQDAPEAVRVLVVPARGYTAADGEEVRSRLAARLGTAVHVTVEVVSAIPRAPNGKFRAVVSRLVPRRE